MIKPGTLCWLVNLGFPQDAWNGRVVTVLGPASNNYCACCTWYRITAEWLVPEGFIFPAEASHKVLRPLHDPDLPIEISKDKGLFISEIK